MHICPSTTPGAPEGSVSVSDQGASEEVDVAEIIEAAPEYESGALPEAVIAAQKGAEPVVTPDTL
jgi:hypothetical protein